MARIRTIKPEFFDSPSTAACTPWARLLYIAMWSLADDWGVGQANMKELAAFAFPNDEQWTHKELPSLCKEVADNYEVTFYTHRGRAYYAIHGWDDHQVTQRRAKRRYPTDEDPESAPDLRFHDNPGTSESSQGTSLSTQGNSQDGTGEQGNRGTGEQERKRAASSDGAGAPHPLEHRVTVAAYEKVGKAFNFIAVRQIVKWALKDRDSQAGDVHDAVVEVYGMGKPITKQTIGQYLDGHLTKNGSGRPLDRQAEILRREMESAQTADLMEIEK